MDRGEAIAVLKEIKRYTLPTRLLQKLNDAIDAFSSCACGGEEPIAQFDDEMIWDIAPQCYVAEICLFIHCQGDSLPVRVIILEEKPE